MTKKNSGRKSIYSEELAKRVCDKISCTFDSLDVMHADNKDWFPHPDTILAWRHENEIFSGMYLQAKRIQAQLTDEELKKIPKKVLACKFVDKDGNEKIDPGAVAAYALISRNIQWSGARLAKGLYSESIEQNVTVRSYEQAIKEIHEKIND